VRQLAPAAFTPKTWLPVPEMTAMPGRHSVPTAQAATTSLTTYTWSSPNAARTSRSISGVTVPATAITAAPTPSSIPADVLTIVTASSRFARAVAAPTASALLGPASPRYT